MESQDGRETGAAPIGTVCDLRASVPVVVVPGAGYAESIAPGEHGIMPDLGERRSHRHVPAIYAGRSGMNALAKIGTPNLIGEIAAKKPLVLLVEDEQTQRMVLRAVLERDGFAVEEAANGLEGLSIYDRVQPDIVLLDVRMPIMDGFATCEALRRKPGGDRLPILMLTILNDIDSINRGYEAGATDFVTKPVAWPVLGHRLRYMLRASEAFEVLARREDELMHRVAERTSERNAANVELAAANNELEAFTYSVSHDLRAPLNVVRGFAAMLKSEAAALQPRERELLGRIGSQIQRMSSMIDDLLRYSRVSRGSDLALEQVDLAALVARMLEILRADYPRAAVTLSQLPSRRCDPALIREVYENLIGNALKFSAKKSEPEVEIGMESREGEDIMFVRDNGAGFDMAEAKTMFGVFRRFHSESDFPGNGVGLAIAKRIVERHRGRIWADSAPGVGTTFYFTLGKAD